MPYFSFHLQTCRFILPTLLMRRERDMDIEINMYIHTHKCMLACSCVQIPDVHASLRPRIQLGFSRIDMEMIGC